MNLHNNSSSLQALDLNLLLALILKQLQVFTFWVINNLSSLFTVFTSDLQEVLQDGTESFVNGCLNISFLHKKTHMRIKCRAHSSFIV